jgi:tRNA(Ile)-lysidine synthase
MDFRGVAVAASPAVAHPGVGVEEAARQERYRILFEAAVDHGAAAVATGHHREDQAETVLLHLLRGGGVHGAAGMAERSPAPIVLSNTSHQESTTGLGSEPWLWRPLLTEAREGIEDYVRGLGLEPIEDPSNDDTTLRRNALRHDVLPLLERQFPGAATALARYAGLAAEDDRLLEEIADTAMAEIVDPGGRIVAASLLPHPLAIRRRLIRRWLGTTTCSNALTA